MAAKKEAAARLPDRVEAVRAFMNGTIGNKEPGDQFDYDLRGDTLLLRELGLVKKIPAPTPDPDA